MVIKVFATGVTGYIGGDAFSVIAKAHPDFEYTCLVRNSDRGAALASQYPQVKLVYGTLDDSKLLEEEAERADIVLDWADADHLGAAHAIAKGLAAHTPDRPAYWIHTSGSAVLAYADVERQIFGEESVKVYDDLDKVGEITSLPDFAPHRDVDKVVLEAGTVDADRVKTAIVCPPTIYGQGRGPGNQRSIQVYWLTENSLKRKQVFQVGPGTAVWNNVHVYDLSNVYSELFDAAIQRTDNVPWGKEAYYFAENGEHTWKEISDKIASIAYKKGLVTSDKVEQLSTEEANAIHPFGAILWGSNSRGKARRARELLGWSPKERSLEKELPEVVESEAKLQGLIQGHAAKVSG
ncbi:NAD(P)-binding protein [Xylona heveae TC161]|uniref:NAD(P)-binding protein n=1 Tax=Xylona heveae (strain CBS 132557 / TC161) TaxID=1328760 RepID=A0A165GZS9_XYLHT|nr:NAD(P)-binding protein [Xylona heveae TC161]KZF22807.1 NAD(P)-binding protein [Xylona heveae TC161]